MPASRSIVACRTWRPARSLLHTATKVLPSGTGDGLLGFWDRGGGLLKGFEQDEEALGTAIEDPEEAAAVVAPQFAQLALDLAAVGEWQGRIGLAQGVEAIDLKGQGRLGGGRQAVDEIADRLTRPRVPIKDRLHHPHSASEHASVQPITAGLPSRLSTRTQECGVRGNSPTSAGVRQDGQTPTNKG